MSRMHMEIRSLKHVVVLARSLSFTKAAQELSLSQSALSRSIQATEHRANMRLFDRDRGRVHLTQAGHAFVERASALVREAEDFERMLQGLATGDTSEVSFGMAPLPAKALLQQLLPEWLIRNPDLKCNIAIDSASALLPLLIEEKIEFFLCAEEQIPTTAPVKSIALGTFPLSFVVRSGHPLLKPHGYETGNQYPVIAAAAFADFKHFPACLGPHLLSPPQLVVGDYNLLAHFTGHSDAIWVTSSCVISNEINEGRLQEIQLPTEEPPIAFQIMMYSLDRRTLSRAAHKLKERLQAEIRLLERNHTKK